MDKTRFLARASSLALAGLCATLLSGCPDELQLSLDAGAEDDAGQGWDGPPDTGPPDLRNGPPTPPDEPPRPPVPPKPDTDPDDPCGAWGTWKLEYDTSTGTFCGQKPSNDRVTIAGSFSGDVVHWAEGCSGNVAVNKAMRDCKLKIACTIAESNPSENWQTRKTLSLDFSGAKVIGQLEIESTGFCPAKFSAPVTATKLP